MLDNTRGSDSFTKLINEKGIRGVHMDPAPDFETTFHTAWQIIHQEAVIEGYDWVFSVEADTIIPPNALELMMGICDKAKFELLTHTYPMHLTDQARNGRTSLMNPKRFVYNELGCCLMTTRLLGLGLADTSRRKNFTDALFQSAAFYLTGWGTMTESMDIKHLDGYHMEFQQFESKPDDDKDDGRWCPLSREAVDDAGGYNVSLPPSIAEDYAKIGASIAPNTRKVDVPEKPEEEVTK